MKSGGRAPAEDMVVGGCSCFWRFARGEVGREGGWWVALLVVDSVGGGVDSLVMIWRLEETGRKGSREGSRRGRGGAVKRSILIDLGQTRRIDPSI